MAKRGLQLSQLASPRNMGPAVTAGPVPLTTPQCCTHRAGVKFVQAKACPCQSTNRPWTSGWPSDNFRNQGPTRAPTAPRFTTNVSKTIEEAQEAAPTLCQAITLVLFHQDAPELSPSVLPRGDDWPALTESADTAHASPALTETDNPDPATPAAVGSGKRNSNRAQPTDGQTASPSPPYDQDSDIILVVSIGEIGDDSDCVESAENSPTIPANTTYLTGHIRELGEMHKVAEGDIVELAQPTVFLSRINEL